MNADLTTIVMTVVVGPIVAAIITAIGVLFTRQENRHQREMDAERAKTVIALAKVDSMIAEQTTELRQFRAAYLRQAELYRQAVMVTDAGNRVLDTNTRVLQDLKGQP